MTIARGYLVAPVATLPVELTALDPAIKRDIRYGYRDWKTYTVQNARFEDIAPAGAEARH